ncbi:LacI family DNA-binding transcriptional regulator [Ancylobacter sp. SL191]|nr:LacI family DNA-binding transcriptional regulator [Ancylobacter sp. SL191]WAC29544.1 LacI family DNA-binding transcriptional regulator [Ancylobacter sp. SL191]
MTDDDARLTARPSAAVTLSDVAREARVGESTASRVLRSQGSFSEKTRKRVAEAAERLGYTPNRIAGTLASTGSRLIGIVVPSFANIVFSDVLSGANRALDAAGFQSVIGLSEYQQEREEHIVRSLLSWRPAGLILAGLEHSPATTAMLRNSGVRIAELLDIDGEGIDIVVGFSNVQAGRASAAFLLSRGYRNIGYVGHDLERDRRAAKRFAGFSAALAEQGISLADHDISPAPSSVEAGQAGLTRLLERGTRLDAVYFSNDDMALGGYFLCQSKGIAIPEKLALFGYNGLDIARFTPLPLSTIRTPRLKIGETGAHLIATGAPPQTVDLGFELIEGATA